MHDTLIVEFVVSLSSFDTRNLNHFFLVSSTSLYMPLPYIRSPIHSVSQYWAILVFFAYSLLSCIQPQFTMYPAVQYKKLACQTHDFFRKITLLCSAPTPLPEPKLESRYNKVHLLNSPTQSSLF